MKGLDPAAVECLQRIALGRPDAGPPCTEQVLYRLQFLELIEKVPRRVLPWEPARHDYRLTPLGEYVLQRS